MVKNLFQIEGIINSALINKTAVTAAGNIRFVYYFVLYIALSNLITWERLVSINTLDALWPVWWVSYFNTGMALVGIRIFFVFSALLAAIKPGYFFVRVIAFLGALQFIASYSSVGKINHGFHLLLFVLFFLIFLPNHWDRKDLSGDNQKKVLIVFWGCQAISLITYFLSGLWKINGIIVQLLRGEISSVSPLGMAYQVADRLIATSSNSLLGDFFINNYLISWPLYFGAIILEVGAVLALFKPVLQKPVAISLILMHIGIFMTMDVSFIVNVFILSALFLNTPFIAKSWRKN